MPLRDVFAGLKEQTGVEVGFWPPGDMNERICVTLYLNPEQPPTLRELMAQLSWVMDCAFALSQGDEPRYWLLSTSIGQGVAERLEAEVREEGEQRRVRMVQQRAGKLAEFAGRLDECREALRLSREELIGRYKGVDDSLLLAMLDPARRAQVRFVLSSPEDDLRAFLAGEQIQKSWDEWGSEQQEALKVMLGPTPDYWGHDYDEDAADRGMFGQPGDWLDDLQPIVMLEDSGQGQIQMGAMIFLVESPRSDRDVKAVVLPTVRIAQGADLRRADETIVLRRLLGEAVTEEEEAAIRHDFEEARGEKLAQEERQRAQEVMAERMGPERELSPETEAKLQSLVLRLERGASYALWQIQEAVAAGSGVNVMSDCFWQPPRRIEEYAQLLSPEAVRDSTALLVLALSCVARRERSSLRREADDRVLGWEWGEAGGILRFRSTSRDVWRASLLPEQVLRRLDEWLASYAEDACRSEASGQTVEVTIQLREMSWLAAHLDQFEGRFGGRLTYGDPADAEHAFRQILRAAVLDSVAMCSDTLRPLQSLTEDQWNRAGDEGLRWGHDLSSGQRSGMERSVVRAVPDEQKRKDVVLTVALGGPIAGPGGVPIRHIKHTYELRLSLGGEVLFERRLPRTIAVRLERTERLVEGGAGAEPE
jgi:hypothetical protein